MSQLRWQCRRGMKELDALLLRYLDTRFERAPEADKRAFAGLLSLSDPQLIDYLLNGRQPAPEYQRVVNHLLERTDT